MDNKKAAKSIVAKTKVQAQNNVNSDNLVFKECLNVVAGTKEGQYVLNRLMDVCGGIRSPFHQNVDGVVDKLSSEYRGGRQSVWLYELRKYISVKNLKVILFLDRSKIWKQQKKVQEKD